MANIMDAWSGLALPCHAQSAGCRSDLASEWKMQEDTDEESFKRSHTDLEKGEREIRQRRKKRVPERLFFEVMSSRLEADRFSSS